MPRHRKKPRALLDYDTCLLYTSQALLHSGVLHGQVCVFLQGRCSIRGYYREENRLVFPSGVRDCAGNNSKFRFQAAQGKLIKT